MQNTQLITPNDQSINQEAEISLQDILNFLAQSWKKLLVASILGTVGGFVVWYFFIGFTAEINLVNSNTKCNFEK
jgi:capsular polysaccharide biosynthesis protein